MIENMMIIFPHLFFGLVYLSVFVVVLVCLALLVCIAIAHYQVVMLKKRIGGKD